MIELKRYIKPMFYWLLTISLKKAAKQQKFVKLVEIIKKAVPDVTKQYTTLEIDSSYLNTKVRVEHAFQISLAMKVVDLMQKDKCNIVDIGDSAGTHIQYLHSMFPDKVNALSVNIDENAVLKIQNKGLKAIHAKAEELVNHPELPGGVDIFLSYEMLEHLMDPLHFLHSLSENTDCEFFVITVPYLAQSRVGLHQIRRSTDTRVMAAENTHIFELSPEDWKLLFQLSGWEVYEESIYTQYPKYGLFRLLQPVWRRFDFEGFYGCVLHRNNTYSKKYQDW